jgi:hypothetical protein
MAIANSLRVNTAAVETGEWFKLEANSDGSVPAFLLARTGKSNKRYVKRMRLLTRDFGNADGVIDDSVDEEAFEAAHAAAFAETILLGWENFQPDDNGVLLTYSREAATALLQNPEWEPLFALLQTKAAKAGQAKQRRMEADAKN